MPQFIYESWIAAPPNVVFAWHEQPDALVQLLPPWENMTVVAAAESLRPGQRVILHARVGLIPLRWVAVHTVYDPPHLFVDSQERGPFRSWEHRHCFIPEGHGTRLRDEITYTLRGGWIAHWLADWYVRRKLKRLFTFRHQRTKVRVEKTEPIASTCGHTDVCSM